MAKERISGSIKIVKPLEAVDTETQEVLDDVEIYVLLILNGTKYEVSVRIPKVNATKTEFCDTLQEALDQYSFFTEQIIGWFAISSKQLVEDGFTLE